MSDNLTNEEVITDESANVDPIESLKLELEAKFESEVKGMKKEISTLSRLNNDLKGELTVKTRTSKTWEERVADIEAERDRDRSELQRVKAFTDAELGEPWRKVVTMSDPGEQAAAIRDLLERHKADVTTEFASNFDTAGAPGKAESRPSVSLADTENMSIDEINEAVRSGRIR